MIKYIIYKHTQDYSKYLGYISVDDYETALLLVRMYLSRGYNVDIRIKQEKPL